MGTVARKKPAKKAEVTNGHLFEIIDTTCLEASTNLTYFVEDVSRTTKSRQVTQSLLEAAVRVKRLRDEADAAYKAFEAMAKKHHEDGGSFSSGRVAITFPETVRRSPKWKDEAIKVAGELAEERGEEFNVKEWVDMVIETYPTSTSQSVALVESEG